MTAGAAYPESHQETGHTLITLAEKSLLTQSISRLMVTSFCRGTVCGEFISVQLVSRSPFVCTIQTPYSRKGLVPMPPVPVFRHLRCFFSQGISIRGGVTYTATVRIITSEKSFRLTDGMASASCSGVTVTFMSSSKDTNGSSRLNGQIPALIFRSSQC